MSSFFASLLWEKFPRSFSPLKQSTLLRISFSFWFKYRLQSPTCSAICLLSETQLSLFRFIPSERISRIIKHCTHYLSSHLRAQCMISKHFLSFFGNNKLCPALLPLFSLVRTIYSKQLIRFGFCEVRNNQNLGKCYLPRPSASTDNIYFDLVIPDIAKLSSSIVVYSLSFYEFLMQTEIPEYDQLHSVRFSSDLVPLLCESNI